MSNPIMLSSVQSSRTSQFQPPQAKPQFGQQPKFDQLIKTSAPKPVTPGIRFGLTQWKQEDAARLVRALRATDDLTVLPDESYYKLIERIEKMDSEQERHIAASILKGDQAKKESNTTRAKQLRKSSYRSAKNADKLTEPLQKARARRELLEKTAHSQSQAITDRQYIDALAQGKSRITVSDKPATLASRHCWYGIIRPDGTQTSDEDFSLVGDIVRKALGNAMPATGVATAMKATEPGAIYKTRQCLKDIRKFFQYESKEKDPVTGEPVLTESAPWSFFEAVISGDKEVPPQWQHLVDEIDKLPLFELTCPENKKLEASMRDAFKPYRRRLIALTLSNLTHVGEANVSEALLALAIGGSVSLAGEIGAEKLQHALQNIWLAMGSRAAGTFVADVFDNGSAEAGQALQRIRMNNLDPKDPKDMFNTDTWLEAAMKGFPPNGKAGPIIKTAGRNAFDGASLCIPVVPAVAFVLSASSILPPQWLPLIQAVVGAIGTASTGFSILLTENEYKEQMKEAVTDLVANDVIPVDPKIKSDPEKLDAELEKLTQQNLCMRLSTQASNMAWPTGPAVMFAWMLSQYLGVPPEVVLPSYMFFSPGMENLGRVGYTSLLKLLEKRRTQEVTRDILTTPNGFNQEQKEQLYKNLTGSKLHKVNDGMYKFATSNSITWVREHNPGAFMRRTGRRTAQGIRNFKGTKASGET